LSLQFIGAISVADKPLGQVTYLGPHIKVVKVPWDARQRRFCTSDYWQIAFLHLEVRKKCTGTVGAERIFIKRKYRLRKKGKYGIEYSLVSASDGPCPHGWGPR